MSQVMDGKKMGKACILKYKGFVLSFRFRTSYLIQELGLLLNSKHVSEYICKLLR